MSYNLAELPQEERQKMAVDMAAAAVAYKLRYGMSVIVGQIELEQPPETTKR
jgi:DNA polymerase-3 subunit theta